MPLLGVCAHAVRTRRTTADGTWRPKLLPQTPWFLKTLKENGIDEQMEGAGSKIRSSVELPCDCIVNVGRGKTYEGPLTDWNDEEEFFWELYGRPYSVCSLAIRSCFVLKQAAKMQKPMRLHSEMWSPQVPAASLEMCGFAAPVSSRSTLLDGAGLAATLQVSEAAVQGFFANPVCLAVPPPVLQLVKKGQWRSFLMHLKWHSRKRGAGYEAFAANLALSSLHREFLQRGVLNSYVPVPSLEFRTADAMRLARFLKNSACDILAPHSLDDDTFQATQLSLEEAVLKLETFAGVWQAKSAIPHARHNQHSHDKIVKALCACLNLRSKADLGATVCMALDALFPGLSDDLKAKLPSGSSLSRKQIFVDSAFCCHWREILAKHRGPIYVWADSSPQGGVDWLLSIIRIIKQEQLETVVDAADFLVESVEGFLAAYACDDKQTMASIAHKRHSQGCYLARSVVTHRQIPMALGAGSTSLEVKARCMLRKMFVESQSIDSLKSRMTCVRSFTTDMGTEMALPDMSGVRAEDVLPEFMLEPELRSEEGLLQDTNEAAGDDSFLFANALLSPGLLHICHNMVKEINSSLPMWPDWLVSFKAVAKLLHDEALRKRLLAVCIQGTPFAWLEEVFKKGVAKPIDWRWGNVVLILPESLSCKNALQAVWSPALFKSNDSSQQDDGRGDDSALNVDVITRAIQSKKFWLQCEVVLSLNQVAADFASWAEGCECHNWLRPLPSRGPAQVVDARKAWRRREYSEEAEQLAAARAFMGLSTADGGDGSGFVCPMAGCRAPELACGAAQTHFERLASSHLQDLMHASLGVDAEEVQQVLTEFSHGKAAMQAYVNQKLQCWEVLPWKLCGVASSIKSRARQCAKACLDLFEASPQDPKLHHRLTWLHLREGSPVREELEVFVAGEPLVSLPRLQALVYELKFVPTVERMQEADHSIVSRMVQYRKVSGPYVSLCLRLPEVRQLMSSQKAYEDFLLRFEEVEQVDDLAKRFGFFKHPLWKKACRENQSKKERSSLAAVLMYSMDVETQYQSMAAAKKRRQQNVNKRKQHEEKWKASMQTPRSFSQRALEEQAMASHLQTELQVGRLYSLPSAAVPVQSLQDALKPLHLQEGPGVPHGSQPQPTITLMPDVESFCGEIVTRQESEPEAEASAEPVAVY